MEKCPICGIGASTTGHDSPDGDLKTITCKRCGVFRIGAAEESVVRNIAAGNADPAHRRLAGNLHLVSGHIRERAPARERAATSVPAAEHREPPLVTLEFAEQAVTTAPKLVAHKIDRLLLSLSRMSDYPGHAVEIDYQVDYPLAYCSSYNEFEFYLEHLEQSELVVGQLGSSPRLVTLTTTAWNRIAEIEQSSFASSQAFVAMSFSPRLEPAYEEGIRPGVEDAGYRPCRIDREEHVDRIDDRMVVEIDRSRFLVADVTGHSLGVYFEAGYALGKKLPVIWTCSTKDFDEAHFDTEHYNHIVWESEHELRARLCTRIKAILGEGPESIGRS